MGFASTRQLIYVRRDLDCRLVCDSATSRLCWPYRGSSTCSGQHLDSRAGSGGPGLVTPCTCPACGGTTECSGWVSETARGSPVEASSNGSFAAARCQPGGLRIYPASGWISLQLQLILHFSPHEPSMLQTFAWKLEKEIREDNLCWEAQPNHVLLCIRMGQLVSLLRTDEGCPSRWLILVANKHPCLR